MGNFHIHETVNDWSHGLVNYNEHDQVMRLNVSNSCLVALALWVMLNLVLLDLLSTYLEYSYYTIKHSKSILWTFLELRWMCAKIGLTSTMLSPPRFQFCTTRGSVFRFPWLHV